MVQRMLKFKRKRTLIEEEGVGSIVDGNPKCCNNIPEERWGSVYQCPET